MSAEIAAWLSAERERLISAWSSAMGRRGLAPLRERAESLIDLLAESVRLGGQAGMLPAQFFEREQDEPAELHEVLAHFASLREAITEVAMRSTPALSVAQLQPANVCIDRWMAGVATERERQLRDGLTELNRDLSVRLAERTAAMRKAMQHLEYLERAKSDFVSIAAHELKTPLTLVQGYSAIMREEVRNQNWERMSELAAGIARGTERLGRLIDDLIEVAAIDTDTLDLQRGPVYLDKLVEMAIAETYGQAPGRHHVISVRDVDKLPVIEGDPQKLYQVILRVIGNAMKYTPDGGRVDISGRLLHQRGADGGDHFVELVIADTGIGIDPQHLEAIFNKFYRIDDPALHSTSRARFKGAGPGLGLTIARGIVKAHGGTMWGESQGHDEVRCPGSQFHILLPVRPGRTAAQTETLVRQRLLREAALRQPTSNNDNDDE
jgi:signal transduction histidine kinase